MKFLKSVWYIVGRSGEVEAGKLLARTIAGVPLVLWRDGEGPIATLDRCPHRLAPLSLGKVEEKGLRCGYHGIRFDRRGQCNDNPHGPVVTALQVQTFLLVERHSFLWIWLGAREEADPAQIPNLSFIDRCPPTALIEGYLPTNANHQLLVDNILDLSHADYLHPTSLGGGSTTRARAHVESFDDSLKVRWDMKGDTPFPIHRMQIPDPDALVDQYLEVLWYPSGVMTVENAFKAAGDEQNEFKVIGVHAMIPEGEFSTHYFYTVTRNHDLDDEHFSAMISEGLKAVFLGEDKVMIEAQQKRIGHRDIGEYKPVLLSTDAAGTRARRTYAARLSAEENEAQLPTAARPGSRQDVARGN
jgi:phenylpropionate dioxygenase-like ring-hydroxylating dioxygenase large terminal subunit